MMETVLRNSTASLFVLLFVTLICWMFLVREVRRRRQAEAALREAVHRLERGAVSTDSDIMERLQAEDALRASERRERDRAAEMAALLDAVPTPVFVSRDPECRHITGNRAADELLRNPRGGEASLGAPPDTRPNHFRVFEDGRELAVDELPAQRAARGQRVEGADLRLVFDDGTVRDVIGHAIPLQNAEGQPRGSILALTDITEHKRIEAALERTRDTLAEAQKIAHLGSFEYIAATGSTVWSEEEYRIYGLDPTGPSPNYDALLAQCIHPDDAALLHETFSQAMRSGGIYELEHRIVRPDGRVRWVYDRARPFFDEDGNLVRYVGATLDITKRKQAETLLRQSREDLDRAATVGQIGWWRLDTVHNVLTWSDENHRIFGIPKGTPLTYETFLSSVHPDDRAEVDARWTAGLRGAPYEFEHRIVADGKVKWVREKAYLEFDSNGVLLGGFGITQDISDRKATEVALRASLQEKEVLLKEIHHRVKNNMQVISSIVSLQADQTSDQAIRAVLQDVIYRVRSMALVHEKLYQSADFARVQFAEYAESLLHYLWRAHGSAAAGIRLTLDLHPVLLSVTEAVPFGLILNELASNALKHAFHQGNGSEVAVSLRTDPSGRVCLRVRDDGQGLPAGVDWRTANSLGLQLVQILAKQLHADVEAVSRDGTEFAVAFGGAKS